jgi:hypothetical protein
MSNYKCPVAQGYVLNPNPFPFGCKHFGWRNFKLTSHVRKSRAESRREFIGWFQQKQHPRVGLHYKSNMVLVYQVFGASIDWSTHFWSTAKTSDQGSTFVHEPYIHTYIHTVEMKSNSLNKSPNGWMGCFFMNDLSSSLGIFWPQSLEFSTLFRTQ